MSIITERLKRFKKNAEATTATVQFVINDQNAISKALTELTDSEKSILISLKNKETIYPYLNSITPIYKPNKEEITSIPFCITDAICGVAETGSVIISVGADYATYFSMLSKKHIVLLKASNIYDRPRDVFNDNIFKLGKNKTFSLITGPSATADMGSLIRGVHGPEYLHIIVTE